MKRRTVFAVFLMLIGVVLPSFGGTRELEKQLLEAVKGKVYWLPQPYLSDKIEFDPTGQLIGVSDVGSPAVSQLIQIDGLSLHEDLLKITGERMIAALSTAREKKIVMVASGETSQVTVHLASPVSDAAGAEVIWSKIFSGGDPNERLSGFWKPTSDSASSPNEKSHTETLELGGKLGDTNVYGGKSQGVKAPKVLRTNTALCASTNFKGPVVIQLIIDRRGRPAFLMANNPEDPAQACAIAGFSKFVFRPATKNGESVSCLIAIEQDFSSIPR